MLGIVLWICSGLMVAFMLLEYSLKATATRQAREIFLQRLEDDSDDSSSRQLLSLGMKYFTVNAGIFLFPLHPGIATLSLFHSLCATFSPLAAIISFFFTTTIQVIVFIAFAIYFFSISSPSWYPSIGDKDDEDANFMRSLNNAGLLGKVNDFEEKQLKDLFIMLRKLVIMHIEDLNKNTF